LVQLHLLCPLKIANAGHRLPRQAANIFLAVSSVVMPRSESTGGWEKHRKRDRMVSICVFIGNRFSGIVPPPSELSNAEFPRLFVMLVSVHPRIARYS
jgi:hypothetical protein